MLDFEHTHEKNFTERALGLFHYQAKNVAPYKSYLSYLNIDTATIKNVHEIPFLPISFFKTKEIIAKNKKSELTFLSSGTTQSTRSQHHIADINLYKKSFRLGFEYFYGKAENYCIQALLPSYLENKQSSLLFMISDFIKQSKHPLSAFISEKEVIENAPKLKNEKVLLIGVSYALLDLAEKMKLDLSHYTIMETGGMKGRRKEWTRTELHKKYNNSFGTSTIHSEYGMTEMLSQAYSKEKGIFYTPPWLKVLTRPVNEPFGTQKNGSTGILKIIDLANIYSCAFIETADLGKVYKSGSFEVLGRVDYEMLRGCNLLIH